MPGGLGVELLCVRGQDIEGDLNVVEVREVAGGQNGIFAIGVAAHAFRPGQRLRLVAVAVVHRGGSGMLQPLHVGDRRIEELVVVAGGKAQRAAVRGRVGDLGRKVEVVVIVGQIAGGDALSRARLELLEGKPGRFRHGRRAVFADDRLRQHALPVVEFAIDGDRPLGDDIGMHLFVVDRQIRPCPRRSGA